MAYNYPPLKFEIRVKKNDSFITHMFRAKKSLDSNIKKLNLQFLEKVKSSMVRGRLAPIYTSRLRNSIFIDYNMDRVQRSDSLSHDISGQLGASLRFDLRNAVNFPKTETYEEPVYAIRHGVMVTNEHGFKELGSKKVQIGTKTKTRQIPFRVDYSFIVHEKTDPTIRWNDPKSGPKFLDKAVNRNYKWYKGKLESLFPQALRATGTVRTRRFYVRKGIPDHVFYVDLQGVLSKQFGALDFEMQKVADLFAFYTPVK